MIDLPLPLKIEVSYSSNIAVEGNTFGDAGMLQDRNIYKPNGLSETIDLRYTQVTLSECQEIESALLSTRGVERIRFAGKKYLLKDGYSVKLNNNWAEITLSLDSVG